MNMTTNQNMTHWTRKPIAWRHEGKGSMTQTGTMTKLQNKRHKNKKTEPQNRPYIHQPPKAVSWRPNKTKSKKSRRVVEWRRYRCSPGGKGRPGAWGNGGAGRAEGHGRAGGHVRAGSGDAGITWAGCGVDGMAWADSGMDGVMIAGLGAAGVTIAGPGAFCSFENIVFIKKIQIKPIYIYIYIYIYTYIHAHRNVRLP